MAKSIPLEPAAPRPNLKRNRILMVEDHPILREGMAKLINHEEDMVVCAEAETAHDAIEMVDKHKPDLLLLDITLKDGSGLDVLKELKSRHPHLPTLILSMHDESLYAERALRAGARGYVMKGETPAKVITAIRRVLANEISLSEDMTRTALVRLGGGKREASTIEELSDRELEIFQAIGRGLSTREIADTLHLSMKTIASHRENIKVKLKLKSSSDLMKQAIHWMHTNRLV